MYNMQCVDLENLDYPLDEFTQREGCANGSYVFVVINSEYTPRNLRKALRTAGITDNTCLVHVSW